MLDILIAEDDEDQFFLLKKEFEKLLIINSVKHVSDGEELLDYLFNRAPYQSVKEFPQPALILLDLNMPKKDGLEALKEIRASPLVSSIPVIILTVSKDKKDILRCYAAGANSYITKPLGLEEFLRALKELKLYCLQLIKNSP